MPILRPQLVGGARGKASARRGSVRGRAGRGPGQPASREAPRPVGARACRRESGQAEPQGGEDAEPPGPTVLGREGVGQDRQRPGLKVPAPRRGTRQRPGCGGWLGAGGGPVGQAGPAERVGARPEWSPSLFCPLPLGSHAPVCVPHFLDSEAACCFGWQPGAAPWGGRQEQGVGPHGDPGASQASGQVSPNGLKPTGPSRPQKRPGLWVCAGRRP